MQAKRPEPVRPDERSLPKNRVRPYPRNMADRTLRRFQVDEDLWEAYARVVGNGGRSADLRRYMEWRVAHPDEPLPGEWRGPVRKERTSSPASDS